MTNRMEKKTRVLIAYKFKSEIDSDDQIIYSPELVEHEKDLRAAIREHRPSIIIVGNNSVQSETLQVWREDLGSEIELTLIRRGTSLSRIHIERANQLNINVLNTKCVNSRFVVEYMIDHLHLSKNSGSCRIGILGSGAIGGRIAYKLSSAGHQVKIYSPSLTTPDLSIREKILRSKGIASSAIQISMRPEQTIENVTHLIIAIDAEKVNDEEEKLSADFFRSIPNGTRIVSVTEFRVFAQGGLDILIERIEKGELSARLDSHGFDLDDIKSRPAFLEATSTAMKGPGCGEAMDQAALIVLANVVLEQTLKSPLIFPKNSSEKKEEISIIGAGILGLVSGFLLSENGYQVKIIDEHVRPQWQSSSLSSNEYLCRGTTLDGCDARHASVTETMPHAVFYRIHSLGKYPLDPKGGWRIIPNQFSPREKLWIDRFIELAGYPELIVYLINQFVANLNRRGMELWKEIALQYPQIIGETFSNDRIIRICSSMNLLNSVDLFQQKYHSMEENLQRLTRAEVLEKIPSIQLKDGDAGGIEVPGFTINHQKLCRNLIEYLEKKANVQFQWSTQVQSLDRISSNRIVFASSLHQIDLPFFDHISLAVQGVLGCWIELPNVHLRKVGFKITGNEPLGVINVTPSDDQEHLYVTGGFAFCGHREEINPSKYLDQLTELFSTTIESYLPDEMKEAKELGNPSIKYCIRPMTPDGMPILQEFVHENKKQKLYFLGGTNSGGFVQSSVLGSYLFDLIEGSTNTNLSLIYRSLRLYRNTLLFHSI